MRLALRNARALCEGSLVERDVVVEGGRVAAAGPPGLAARAGREADLEGRVLLPGLVNGHDHLGFSTFPPLGRPPYASVYDWAADVDGGSRDPAAAAALEVPLEDRLFLGGLRNLLSGVTAVVHHDEFHEILARPGFSVRVLSRYASAHSPGLTPGLRATYRADRPWMVHAAEGTDALCRGEIASLHRAGLLRANTVLVHGVALDEGGVARVAASGAALVWCPESNRALYGATAPVARLRAVGVRLGLGSDSPVSGVRDPLSNLAAARREGALDDGALLDLATRGTAEVARLPLGGPDPGAPADLVAVDSLDALLSGDRRAIALVVVAGRPLYGRPDLMQVLDPLSVPMSLDGEPRRVEEAAGERAARVLRDHPRARRAAWATGLGFEAH